MDPELTGGCRECDTVLVGILAFAVDDDEPSTYSLADVKVFLLL